MQWIARQQFHRTSTSMQSWGAVLLIAACALWVRLAFLLVEQSDASCYGETQNCGLIEAWPEQLTILAVSVPLSVLGTVLFVAGTVRRQISAHVLEVIEMQRAEKRARQKKA
ncbi:hypothetical protein ACFCXC_01070 [Streptomyces microflavus]|uniref:Uncharacterized protein n=3 Tax=Streptomyces microflavus TaxID=1919 RepID=A0A6N9V0Y1_STRMI|nr:MULTISPECIES: hypothetical protein [Streptomyces]MBK3588990.1 hypothetical protein [Streptomyces sp. MBT57]AGK79204.1 hypothetical protein SFUL_4303 [Streptomyces microflavus DSM 40593]MBK5994089.1 hypothetical protein [Streptomyces sp. MBT58]MBW3360348.1 hypothetical protein [Streptomyces sp. 09ZI22]MCX4654350.1 hypothetical protein [Streptomyces microflavus]